MCGRFASQLPPEEVARLFSTAGDVPNLGPNWNVAPTQAAMVIRRHPETGERRLDVLRWGLVPHFTKDLKKTTRPINARAETVATSGMFRGALASRRCIVPSDGTPVAFAGLWEGWKGPDGETLRTFTIVTTEANADMARLHNRMPVILELEAWPV
jgi:putative SOS response-associated peptidase YedK